MSTVTTLIPTRIQNIRTVFADEARDFTPAWKANKEAWFAALGKELDIEFDVSTLEVEKHLDRNRGGKSIDLLIKDTDGYVYVIENQYGTSDEAHFSKSFMNYLPQAGIVYGEDNIRYIHIAEHFDNSTLDAFAYFCKRQPIYAVEFYFEKITFAGNDIYLPHFVGKAFGGECLDDNDTTPVVKQYYNEDLFNPILTALGLPTGKENIAKCETNKIYLKHTIDNGKYMVTSVPAFLEDKGFNARLKIKASKKSIKVYFGTWSIRKDLTINSYDAADQLATVCEKYTKLVNMSTATALEAGIEMSVKDVTNLTTEEIQELNKIFNYVYKAARGE